MINFLPPDLSINMLAYVRGLLNPHAPAVCGPWLTGQGHQRAVTPQLLLSLTLKRLGGGPKRPPLDISRDYSATHKALAATLWLFSFKFPAHFDTQICDAGVRFWSYVTFCTCTSDRKWLQNVILCTKSMQIEFFHIQFDLGYPAMSGPAPIRRSDLAG